MNSEHVSKSTSEGEIEPEPEIVPESAHRGMPWFLLAIWIAMIIFFFYYFIKFGWPNLETWLDKSP